MTLESAIRKMYAPKEKDLDALIESLDEAGFAKPMTDMEVAKSIRQYAKKSGGIDKADFMKAADMLAKGKKSQAIAFAKKLDTDPRDWLLDKLGEESIEEGYEDTVMKVLKKKRIDGRFDKGNLYVDKKSVSAAKAALKGDSNIKELPKIIGEEVELDESFKKGDKVTVNVAKSSDRELQKLSKKFGDTVSGVVIGQTGKIVMVKTDKGQINPFVKDVTKEEVEIDERKMSDLSMKIDDVVAKMKKDRQMKAFANKFKQDVMKSMNIQKSLEKVLPDYISGKDIQKVMSEEKDDEKDDKETAKKAKKDDAKSTGKEKVEVNPSLEESKMEDIKESTHTMERLGVSRSLVDAVANVIAGKRVDEDNTNDKSDDGDGMDKVQPKALKKKFKDRKDKDIDNDGDVDDSDEYLHNRRKAVSKAIKTDEAEMSDAQMKKREEIVKELKKKEDYFKEKYGDKAKEVMYATATKMAMKEHKGDKPHKHPHEEVKEGLEDKTDNPANSQHLCAKNVVHESWGEGTPIHGQHAEPDDNGDIAWYDVMFEHGIEKEVSISELKVTKSESHNNHKKKK